MSKIFKLISKRTKEDLYYKYADSMMLLCLRYTGKKEDAEELMNNGFLKVFKNLDKFIELHKNSFRAWLKKIMINECLMYIRKNNGFNIISLDDADVKFQAEEPVQNQDTDYLLKLLEELPAGYRTVFNLYIIEGYKHKEISEMLNISENTSRTQLLKARKQLQQKITEQNKEYGS